MSEPNFPRIRLNDLSTKPKVRVRVLPALLPLNVSMQNTGAIIQWRIGDGPWMDLITIDDINASVSVGTVTTLPAGSPATVVNVGTPQDVILNFGIPSGGVSSVNSQTGVVILNAGNIGVTPTGNIASTDIQSALAELDSEKQPLDSDLTSWALIARASGFDTFVVAPSSANLRALLTDESGTGSAYFQGGDLGTPSAGIATNLSGTAASLTAGHVTTNANLTGDVTSVGNATTLTNAPVIAKVLTGYVSGAGVVAATDSILQAIQKLNGNDVIRPIYTATRTTMAALTGASNLVVWLEEAGRQGWFQWNSANLSTQVTADPQQGVYVAPASATTGASGAWVRQYGTTALNVFWFGAVGDGTTDDVGAFSAAYTLAKSLGSSITEGPIGNIYAPGGYRYKFGSSLSLDVPVWLHIDGYIEYTPTSAATLIIGSVLPTAGHNTGYDISLAGIRATNGNSSPPVSINTSGSIGIEVRNMQFSRLYVGETIGFTYAGFYGNCTNNVYTGQQVQDNDISVGLTAYNGVGFLAESVSAATGAFQVNVVKIQNSFTNWNNLVLGKAADANTGGNIVTVNALDADSGGGSVSVYGWYNNLQLGYVTGVITLQSGAQYNTVLYQVGNAQATVTDSSGNTLNKYANVVEGTLSLQKWQTAGLLPVQSLQSTEPGASAAALLEFYRNSASPAANDQLAALDYMFNNSTPAKVRGGRIMMDLPTVTAGGENSRFLFQTFRAGTFATRLALWQGAAIGATATDQGLGTVNVDVDYFLSGASLHPAPVTKTADFTLGLTESNVICNKGSTLTVTLPAASSFSGRRIRIKTIQAFTVVSASSNVAPMTSATAGTAILAATAGKWADLQSDGTNWIIMAGN